MADDNKSKTDASARQSGRGGGSFASPLQSQVNADRQHMSFFDDTFLSRFPMQYTYGGQSDSACTIVEEPFPSALSLGTKLAVSTIFYPIEYTRVLMQIGHEPIAPVAAKSWLFQRPCLLLPSVLHYIGHVKRQSGSFISLYSGLGPRLINNGIEHAVVNHLNQVWPEESTCIWDLQSANKVTDNELARHMAHEIKRKCTIRFLAALLTHPLHVVQIRVIAQFVGRESRYSGLNLWQSFQEIFRENGLFGFFSGLIPRLVGEALFVAIATTLTYTINRYLLTDVMQKKFTAVVTNYVASSLTYPMFVVANTSVVSRSGLAAGYPPHMPLYSDWIHCYRHLSSRKSLNRGSALLIRYYTGPQIVLNGKAVPI